MANRLLHRDVVKLVTPGTLLEPLHHHANYLMAIAVGPTLSSALAWLDLSTSDFQVRNLALVLYMLMSFFQSTHGTGHVCL